MNGWLDDLTGDGAGFWLFCIFCVLCVIAGALLAGA